MLGYKKKIAITGGIGSGKSTVLSLVKKLGFEGFSCDEIYKEILESPSYIAQISARFPHAIKGDSIDKKALSSIVFADKNALQDLNDLAHPLIMERLERCMGQAQTHLVFAEVPLLFEGGYSERFDHVFVVFRKKEDRIVSVCLRDQLPEQAVVDRINHQYSYSSLEENDKIIFIKNDGDIETLQKNLEEILSKIPMPL